MYVIHTSPAFSLKSIYRSGRNVTIERLSIQYHSFSITNFVYRSSSSESCKHELISKHMPEYFAASGFGCTGDSTDNEPDKRICCSGEDTLQLLHENLAAATLGIFSLFKALVSLLGVILQEGGFLKFPNITEAYYKDQHGSHLLPWEQRKMPLHFGEGRKKEGREGRRQGGSIHFISNSQVFFFANVKVCDLLSFQNAGYEELCSSLASENTAQVSSFSGMS